MPGRQVADVIFCLDASGSMKPCFDALRKHVGSFVQGLESSGQFTWDLRLDFLAYRAGESRSGGVFAFQSVHNRDFQLIENIYRGTGQQSKSKGFFTTNIADFVDSLGKVTPSGDEATFVALDTALDFPWRKSVACHRIVIILTDEALETGVQVTQQIAKIPALIEKLHALRVKLFIVGPSSDAFDAICAADRSEFQVLNDGHDGLKNADLKKILEEIGKSVSVSALQGETTEAVVRRGLFGQEDWTTTKERISGG